MKKTTTILFFLSVLGITSIALLLRVWAVRKLPIDHDEGTYLLASSLYAQTIQQHDWPGLLNITYNNQHPSFAKFIYGLSLSEQKLIPIKRSMVKTQDILSKGTLKDMLMTVRNVTMVFGVLSVTILAIFNPIAGLFLAVHSFAIKYTSVAYLEAIPAFTSLLTALAYLRWITLVGQQPKPLAFKRNFRVHRWLALSGLFFGITVASKFAFGLIGIAIVIHFTWKTFHEGYPLKQAILFLAGYGVVSAIVFFMGDIYLWADPVHKLLTNIQFHLNYQESIGDGNVYPVWQIFNWLSKSVLQQDSVAVPHLGNDILLSWDLPIFILAIAGLPRLFKKNLLFFLWLILTIGFLLAWQTKWPQYVMLVVTPLCLSASEGFHLIILDPLVKFFSHRRFKTSNIG
jgi:hypothetical protein